MLDQFDTLIGFAVVMLGASLLITILVQMVSALLGLRGTNLLWGIEVLLKTADSKLPAGNVKTIAESVLTDPIISNSRFSQVRALPLVGQLTRRWKFASAIRFEELTKLLKKLAEENRIPSATAIAQLLQSKAADLQTWFNAAMDRTAQRFITHTRLWTVIFAFLLAFVAHLDSFHLYNQISSKPELRARLGVLVEDMKKIAEKTTAAVPAGTAQPTADEIKTRTKELSEDLQAIRNTLDSTQLRLIPDPYPGFWTFPGEYGTPGKHFLGMLVSALLLSLGAPFWYNILKALTNLRPLLAQKEEAEKKKP